MAGRTGRYRRPTLLLAALVAAVVPLGLSQAPAGACTCTEPPPPRQAAIEADVVLLGEVTSTRLIGGSRSSDLVAHIEVDRVFRGEPAEVVNVRTAPDSGMCGYPFREGETELPYAQLADDGELTTSLCSRSTSLDAAAEDLAALGDGAAPTEGTSMLLRDGPARWWYAIAVAGIGLVVVAAVVVTSRSRVCNDPG